MRPGVARGRRLRVRRAVALLPLLLLPTRAWAQAPTPAAPAADAAAPTEAPTPASPGSDTAAPSEAPPPSEAAAAPAGVPLEVTAGPFASAEGQALFALYDTKAAWLKLAEARAVLRLPAATGEVTARFEGVPPGTYAIAVIHDENGNGRLDMKWFPLPGPAEWSGTSNDAVARLGPPGWKDSTFTVAEAPVSLRITLRR